MEYDDEQMEGFLDNEELKRYVIHTISTIYHIIHISCDRPSCESWTNRATTVVYNKQYWYEYSAQKNSSYNQRKCCEYDDVLLISQTSASENETCPQYANIPSGLLCVYFSRYRLQQSLFQVVIYHTFHRYIGIG